MTVAKRDGLAYLRTGLVLGRVSNLPTVWSNCVAAWWISGGGTLGPLLGVCLGASFLYLGGMYLNDWFDADFDRQHRPSRPIPAGQISAAAVGRIGWTWLALGVLALVLAGANHWLVPALVAAIVIYDVAHKAATLAPILMGGCRFLLYLVAASVTDDGIAGLAVWSGLALAAYVAGLSFVARQESSRGRIAWWPPVLLLVPVTLALIANTGVYRDLAVGLSLLLAIWILVSVGPALSTPNPDTPALVCKLIAGITLVDLLAVGGEPLVSLYAFAALFGLTRLAQRYVPGS